MARQAAGNDEDGVDPDVVAGTGEARSEALGGNGNAAEAIFVERQAGSVVGRALLDLDERHHAAAPRDQIDLAAGRASADGEDPPALEPQPPGGEPLGAAAPALGRGAVQRASSSARA